MSGTLEVTFEKEADDSIQEKRRNAEKVLSPECADGNQQQVLIELDR